MAISRGSFNRTHNYAAHCIHSYSPHFIRSWICLDSTIDGVSSVGTSEGHTVNGWLIRHWPFSDHLLVLSIDLVSGPWSAISWGHLCWCRRILPLSIGATIIRNERSEMDRQFGRMDSRVQEWKKTQEFGLTWIVFLFGVLFLYAYYSCFSPSVIGSSSSLSLVHSLIHLSQAFYSPHSIIGPIHQCGYWTRNRTKTKGKNMSEIAPKHSSLQRSHLWSDRQM